MLAATPRRGAGNAGPAATAAAAGHCHVEMQERGGCRGDGRAKPVNAGPRQRRDGGGGAARRAQSRLAPGAPFPSAAVTPCRARGRQRRRQGGINGKSGTDGMEAHAAAAGSRLPWAAFRGAQPPEAEAMAGLPRHRRSRPPRQALGPVGRRLFILGVSFSASSHPREFSPLQGRLRQIQQCLMTLQSIRLPPDPPSRSTPHSSFLLRPISSHC